MDIDDVKPATRTSDHQQSTNERPGRFEKESEHRPPRVEFHIEDGPPRGYHDESSPSSQNASRAASPVHGQHGSNRGPTQPLLEPDNAAFAHTGQQQPSSTNPYTTFGYMSANTIPGSFVSKLYSMVDDPAYEPLIHWNQQGDTFIVNNPNEFSRVLNHFFKHNNWQSFVRQLNMYGFHKVNDVFHPSFPENMAWEFRHPSFRRNQTELLPYIRRKTARTVPATPPPVPQYKSREHVPFAIGPVGQQLPSAGPVAPSASMPAIVPVPPQIQNHGNYISPTTSAAPFPTTITSNITNSPIYPKFPKPEQPDGGQQSRNDENTVASLSRRVQGLEENVAQMYRYNHTLAESLRGYHTLLDEMMAVMSRMGISTPIQTNQSLGALHKALEELQLNVDNLNSSDGSLRFQGGVLHASPPHYSSGGHSSMPHSRTSSPPRSVPIYSSGQANNPIPTPPSSSFPTNDAAFSRAKSFSHLPSMADPAIASAPPPERFAKIKSHGDLRDRALMSRSASPYQKSTELRPSLNPPPLSLSEERLDTHGEPRSAPISRNNSSRHVSVMGLLNDNGNDGLSDELSAEKKRKYL